MKYVNKFPAPRRFWPSMTARIANKHTLGAMVSLLMLSQASADPFFFSTGNPDGKIATLSSPATTGTLNTETADDFLVTNPIVINQATFTGLVPAGTSLNDITQVEIEIYHVFPGDSVLPPSGNVPNRTNSPSDVEIGSATRDSANGSLVFTANVVSANFTALNSVISGIHKQPGQRTMGEGSISGEE